jgi:hypothetical protein
MAHRNERADVVAEIAMLRKQQFESEIDATYLGWTLKAKIANERRTNRIASLVGVLEDLGTSDAPNDGVSRATH